VPGNFPSLFGFPSMLVTVCDANEDDVSWKNSNYPVMLDGGSQVERKRGAICKAARAMVAQDSEE
jgi:hypothetical protein